MALGPEVTLRFKGDSSSVTNAIREVQAELSQLRAFSGREILLTAAGFGILGAAALSAGVVGAASLALIPLALGGIAIAALKKTEEIKNAFTSLKDHVLTKTQELAKPMENVFITLMTRAKDSFDMITPALTTMFTTASSQVSILGDALLKLVTNMIPGMSAGLELAKPAIQAFADGLAGMGTALGKFFQILGQNSDALAHGTKVFFDVLNALIPIVADIVVWLAKWSDILVPLSIAVAGLALAVGVVSALTSAWQAGIIVVSAATKAWSIVQAALNLVMMANPFSIVIGLIALLVAGIIIAYKNSETFRNIVQSVWAAVKSAITTAVEAIKTAINWFAGLPALIGGWFEGMRAQVAAKITAVVTIVKGLPNVIKSALGNMGTLLLSAGKDLLTGLWNGISGAAGWLKSKIASFFGSLLPGWAKDFLGIGSPSKVFRDEVGKWVPEGMAEGIEGNLGVVKKATSRMADTSVGPFSSSGVDIGPLTRSRRSTVTSSSGTGDVNVVVMIDGKEFKGMIRTEISDTNRATRTAVMAGRGAR